MSQTTPITRRPVRWRDAWIDFSHINDESVAVIPREYADGWDEWAADFNDDGMRAVIGCVITVGDDNGNTALATIIERSGSYGWHARVDMSSFSAASDWADIHDDPDDDPLSEETAAEKYARSRERWGPGETGRAAQLRSVVVNRARAGRPPWHPEIVRTEMTRWCTRCVEDDASPQSLLCPMCQAEYDREHN